MLRLAKYLGSKAGIPIGLYSIAGLETVEATDGNKNALFLMNHNSYSVIVPLEKEYTEMITNKKAAGTIRISPYDVAVLG